VWDRDFTLWARRKPAADVRADELARSFATLAGTLAHDPIVRMLVTRVSQIKATPSVVPGYADGGEYNEAVLGGILEYSSDELARLAALGVTEKQARVPNTTRKKSAS